MKGHAVMGLSYMPLPLFMDTPCCQSLQIKQGVTSPWVCIFTQPPTCSWCFVGGPSLGAHQMVMEEVSSTRQRQSRGVPVVSPLS